MSTYNTAGYNMKDFILAPLDGGIMLPKEQMGMDVSAFDTLIQGKAVPLLHHRALKCPIGLNDPQDVHRHHHTGCGCSNGMIYRPIGRIYATLTSNQEDLQKLDIGYVNGASVVATFTRFYDSDHTKRAIIKPIDRFYLEQEDIWTGTWSVIARRRDELPDRLEYPAIQVEHLVDANNQWYHQNIDFDLNAEGDVVWRADKGPQIGSVYSIWYLYRPHFYVAQLIHEIRLFPSRNFEDCSQVSMERIGICAVLVREYIHRTNTPDNTAPIKTQDRQPHIPDMNDLVSV
jgi:hypothetical protein